MTDPIKLARECGAHIMKRPYFGMPRGSIVISPDGVQQLIEYFAKTVEAEHVGDDVYDTCTNHEDAAYNVALTHAAKAIRALIPKGGK